MEVSLPHTPKRRGIIVRDRFGFLIRSFFIHDWHVQSVVKDRDDTRLSGAFRKEPHLAHRVCTRRRRHVSSKPFQHIAAGSLCQPGVHTAFTQGFPQLSGLNERLMISDWDSTRGGKPYPWEPFERKQQHATFARG